MADYNRFISYIYLYERGMKTINTGFAKVESRGGQCRINVTMKNMYHESHVKFSAYMFVRKDKQLVGIYLGDLTTENNTGAFDAVTNTENIEGSGYGLEQVNGMIIRGDNGKIYGTGWDDEALNVDAFVALEDMGAATASAAQEGNAGRSSSEAASGGNAGPATSTASLETMSGANAGRPEPLAAVPKNSADRPASSEAVAGNNTSGMKSPVGVPKSSSANVNTQREADARSAGQDMMRQMAFGKAHDGETKTRQTEQASAKTQSGGASDARGSAAKAPYGATSQSQSSGSTVKSPANEISRIRSAAAMEPEKAAAQNSSGSMPLTNGDDELRLMAESMEALARTENESSLFRSPSGAPGNTGGHGSRNHWNSQRSAGNQNVIIRPDAAAWQSAGNDEKDSSAAMEALATAVDAESLPGVTQFKGESALEAEHQLEPQQASQQESRQETQQASQQETQTARRECPALEKLIDKGLRMYPFEDEQVLACIRMEPQEIGTLPMKYWYLANNSFLLHGYYSYRHLIMAKMGDGRYILGVPGVNYQREQFMAGMFGFCEFKPVQNHPLTGSEFGYWYMELSE